MPWLEPEKVDETNHRHPLTPTQVDSWQDGGFTLVQDLLPTELIEAARNDALAHYPAARGHGAADFGSGGRFVFPAASPAVNTITLHSRLLGAVSQLLDTEPANIRLTQSDLWAKYGRASASGDPLDNDDQRMHVDYPNHTLTHPPPWDSPDAVEMIVYLSDVDDCGGATRVVARLGDKDPAYPWPIVGTPGVAGLEWVNDRDSAEAYLRDVAPAVAEFRGLRSSNGACSASPDRVIPSGPRRPWLRCKRGTRGSISTPIAADGQSSGPTASLTSSWKTRMPSSHFGLSTPTS